MDIGRKINVFNYYPLEFMGGGEYTALFLFNTLRDHFSLTYYSSKQFSGKLRATENIIAEAVKFNYKHIDFLWYSPIRVPIIIKPFPSLLDLDADLNVIYVSGGIPPKFFKELARTDKRVLFLMHGITFEKLRFRSTQDILISIHQLFIRITLQFAFKYVKINKNIFFQIFNKSQENYLKKLGVDYPRLFYIPSGVDFNRYIIGKNEQEFRIVFLSRMENLTKGLKVLKKVVKRISILVPNIKFVLIGTGKDSKIASSMEKHFHSVEYKGFIEDEKKLEELLNANLMISTSNIEPFPLNVLEGLASGLPVVCTDYSGSWAIKENEIFGRVSIRNVKQVTAWILWYYDQWYSNKEKYYQEKLSRRNEAKKFYDSKKMSEEYKKCFIKITAP